MCNVVFPKTGRLGKTSGRLAPVLRRVHSVATMDPPVVPIGNNIDDESVQAGLDEDLDSLNEAQVDLAAMNVVAPIDDDDGNNIADEGVREDIEVYKLVHRAIRRALEAMEATSEEPKETTEVQPKEAPKQPKEAPKLLQSKLHPLPQAEYTEEELLSDKQDEAILGNRTQMVEFKVQSNEYYKYEKRMPAYSKKTEEEQAAQCGAPGYFSLVTTGGRVGVHGNGIGPRVGIPIPDFRELEDDPIFGRLPRKEETPYEKTESNIIKFVAPEYHMLAAAPTMQYNESLIRPAGQRQGNLGPPATLKYAMTVYFHSEHPTFGSRVCQVPLIFVCGVQVGGTQPAPLHPYTPLTHHSSMARLRPFPRRSGQEGPSSQQAWCAGAPRTPVSMRRPSTSRGPRPSST